MALAAAPEKKAVVKAALQWEPSLPNLKRGAAKKARYFVHPDASMIRPAASPTLIKNMSRPMGNSSPVMLEPIMAVEVVTPDEYMGDVISDLNKRRGQVEGMDTKAGARVIKAKVPLSEQFGYVTVLRTLSSGRATSTMEFSHYEPMPANLAKEVLEKVTGKDRSVALQ